MFRILQQCTALNVCLQTAVVLMASTQIVSAGDPPEAWPGKVRDLPQETPASLTWAGFHVAARSVRNPSARSEDEAAPEYRFTIRNISTGVVTSFIAPSAQGAVLERFGGYLQFELWTRGAAGSWSRHLYRFARGQYRCVRIDDFTENAAENKENAITATVPGRPDETLYFVETRTP